ncbi:MAG TPA: hypothetical protein VIF60_14095 [Burkholderiaceae bacterium]|jgi:hypothetical protein
MRNDRRSRTFVLAFVLPVLLFTIAFGALSLFLEPVEGGMTRLGHWSERDFGWHHAQPAIPYRANGRDVKAPTVLVLGDSFTRANIWQSFLSADAGEVLSYHYPDVGCIGNWVKWALGKPFASTDTIVVQTVERELVSRFASIEICAKLVPKPFEMVSGTVLPKRFYFPPTMDAEFIWRTAVNSFHMQPDSPRIVSGKVINVPLTTAKLFSNLESGRILFYRNDELKNGWTEEHLQATARNLKSLQDRFEKAGMHFLIVVIPDKSTVYGPYFAAAQPENKYAQEMKAFAAQAVNTIDLLTPFQAQLPGFVDLYSPNDSHLSVEGYRFLGEIIERQLLAQRGHVVHELK